MATRRTVPYCRGSPRDTPPLRRRSDVIEHLFRESATMRRYHITIYATLRPVPRAELASVESAARALKQGADDGLTKPVDPNELS